MSARAEPRRSTSRASRHRVPARAEPIEARAAFPVLAPLALSKVEQLRPLALSDVACPERSRREGRAAASKQGARASTRHERADGGPSPNPAPARRLTASRPRPIMPSEHATSSQVHPASPPAASSRQRGSPEGWDPSGGEREGCPLAKHLSLFTEARAGSPEGCSPSGGEREGCPLANTSLFFPAKQPSPDTVGAPGAQRNDGPSYACSPFDPAQAEPGVQRGAAPLAGSARGAPSQTPLFFHERSSQAPTPSGRQARSGTTALPRKGHP
jgi:hypothetical protein